MAGRNTVLAALLGASLAAPPLVSGQTPIINTWAGGGPTAGAVATAVSLAAPNSVAKDPLDNYYVASTDTDLVYRVESAGLVSVFAGGGTRQDTAADGYPAREAALNNPSHVVWYGGGLHVVESRRLRRIDTQTGIVSTVMGGGTLPYVDGMAAVDVATACPSGLAISLSGDLYYTDLCDNTIKRIDAAGLVTRVAGVVADPGSLGGDGGPAALALFRRPEELALDPDSGDLAVIDQAYRAETGRVRRISAGSDGVVTGADDELIVSVTSGGCCNVGPGNNGQLALLADMRGLTAIGFDDGRILLGQTYEGPGFLWRVRSNGVLELVAGVDSQTSPAPPGFGDGNGRLAINARFGVLAGIVLAPNLEILIADRGLHAVRRIDSIGAIYRVAGNGAASLSGDGGPAAGAQLYRPSAVQFDDTGTAVIVDQDRGRLRRVDAATGAIGSAIPVMPNGSAFRPLAIALHPTSGRIYFANGDERIHAFDPVSGVVTLVAGTGRRTCSFDCEGGDPIDDLGDFGLATNSTFNSPVSLVFDARGNLYLADLGNHRVRRIDAATGIVQTVAGIDIAGSGGYGGDGGPPVNAQLRNPWAVAFGPDGTLFIADTGNNRIRAVTPQATGSPSTGGGTISTVVNGFAPRALAVDGAGRLFFGGSGYADVRLWDGANVSVYVNSQGSPGFSGDGGPAADARISTARGLAVFGGALFIADDANHRIRVVRAGGGTPDLVVTKGTTSTFQQGGNATYDLTVANAGMATTTGIYTVTDVMPTGLTASGASGDGWDCSASTTLSITCSSSDILAPGQAAPVVTIGVNIAAAAPASISNTASIAGGGEADPTNNTSSVTSPVTQLVPDLTIAKSTMSTFQQGGTAIYELAVSNTGNGPSTGAYTITDVLPEGLTLTSATASSGWDCAASTTQVVNCVSSAALPAGRVAPAVRITVDIDPTAPATITNTATVAGGGETNTANNSASVTSAVTAAVPDLAITKTTTSVFLQGSTAAYTFAVANVGNGPTTGPYTIRDALPAGLRLAGTAPGAGWDCTASTTVVVSCTRGSTLPASQAAPAVTITVDVAATAPASVTNTATVAGGGETNTGNNTASVTSVVTPAVPDLTIAKSTSSTFQSGGTATYVLTVRNIGNGPTTGSYTVVDQLPAGLVLAGTTPGTGWDCTASTTTVVSCVRNTAVSAGQSAPAVSITVNIAATAPTTFTNTAMIAGGGETNTGNNASTVTNILAGSGNPDLALTKATTSTTFAPGGTATYTFTVRNVGTGPTRATYTVTDQLPRGLQLTQSPTGSGWNCSVVASARVTCTSSTVIPAGATAPALTMSVVVAPSSTGSITNTAFVAGGGEAFTASNNFSTVTTPIGQPDLAVSIAASSPLLQGGTATYTFTVANVGGAPAQNARVDMNFGWLPGPYVVAPGSGWTCTSSTLFYTVTCTRSTPIAPAESTSTTVSLTIPTWWPSTATVATRVFTASDANYANNVSSLSSPVTAAGPDLTVSGVASGPLQRGGTVSYTLTVANQGSTLAPLGSFWVVNPPPAGLAFTAAAGAGWVCDITGSGFICRPTAPLAAGATAPVITATASIAPTAPATITNRSSVLSWLDVDSSNNQSLVTSSVAPN